MTVDTRLSGVYGNCIGDFNGSEDGNIEGLYSLLFPASSFQVEQEIGEMSIQFVQDTFFYR
jgi:hypothetical protein